MILTHPQGAVRWLVRRRDTQAWAPSLGHFDSFGEGQRRLGSLLETYELVEFLEAVPQSNHTDTARQFGVTV